MDIKSFRTTYPEYDDYSDDEVVVALQETQYTDFSKQEVAEGLGVTSSKFIDYETAENEAELAQAAKQTQAPAKVEPEDDTTLTSKMSKFFNQPAYSQGTYDDRHSLRDQFFSEHVADRIPVPYRDEYQKQFHQTFKDAENKYSYDRMKLMEQQFREVDPAYGNWFKRTGQSVLRGLGRFNAGLELWERKNADILNVPEDHYENLRKGGWQSFEERYVRRKQYENTGLFDEIVQTVAEFSVPMVAGAMATVALGPAAPALAATAVELGVTTFTAMTSEAGSKRQELENDPRFAGYLDSEKDDMAMTYGLYSGAVEGVGTLVGLKILKSAGSGLVRALSKTPVSKEAVKASGKLLAKVQSAGDTKVGQYLKLVMAPVASGTTEMGEELLQTHIGEALDFYYLNDKDTDIKEMAQHFQTKWADPQYQAELAHTAKVAFGAGALPVGAINTATAVNKAKAQIFTGQKETPEDAISDIDDQIDRINKDVDDALKDPDMTKEAREELIKLREVIVKTEEARKGGAETIDADTIESEAELEAKRYAELFEAEQADVEAFKAEEAAKEQAPEAPLEAAEEVQKEEPVSDTAWKKKTIKDIKTMSKDEAKELVENYEAIPEEQRNRNDNARLREAKGVVRLDEKMEAESKALKEAVMGKIAETPVKDEQSSVQSAVPIKATVDPETDARPKRVRNTGLRSPSGQRPTAKSKLNGGLIFSRTGVLRNTQGKPITDEDLDDTTFSYRNVNRAIIDTIEGKIARGDWRFQELFDAVVSMSPDIEFVLNANLPARGRLTTTYEKDGSIHKHKIQLNPVTITQMHGGDVSGAEVVLVHELLHTLHNIATGGSMTEKAQSYYNDIGAIWEQVDPEFKEQVEYWADEYEEFRSGRGDDVWHNYTEEQQAKRESWYIARDAIEAAQDGSPIMWDELMSMFLSDPNMMADLYNVPSVGNPEVTESIGARLLKAMLVFIDNILGSGKLSPSLMDDFVDLHAKLAGTIELNRQSYAGVPAAEEHRNSLFIGDRKGFPKGSKYLHAAFKHGDKVVHSPVAHWMLLDNFKDSDYASLVDGFAAIDDAGEVTKFYTRQQAAEIVDPTGRVVQEGVMMSEDIVDLNESQDAPVIRKRDGKLEVVGQKEVQKKRRRRLSQADLDLLAARKAARGGKSLADTWADKRKASDREIKKVKYDQKEKQGIPGDRWSLERATDRLVSMKDNTLERELMRMMEKVKDSVQRGYSEKNPQLMYYKRRRDAIELIQEKRIMDKVKVQRAKQAAIMKKAGKTKAANIRFYKAEYKRAIRLDAPVSQVNFIKAQLLDTMGDTFWTWSGETMPVIKARAKQAGEVKKVVETKPLETPEKKGEAPVVKVLEPFTEEDQKKAEKGTGTDTELSQVARDAEEAATVYYAVMGHMREQYVAKKKIVKTAYADQIMDKIVQAHTFKIIDDQQKADDLNELATAMMGTEDSFESRTTGELDALQIKMDEMMPVKVKFDAYYAKDSGYMPGYSFTIMDKNHPANKGSFVIQELTQKAIDEKFAQIDSMYGRHSTSQEMKWTPVANNVRETIEDSEMIGDNKDEFLRLDIKHHTMGNKLFNPSGELVYLPLGTKTTNVAFSLYDGQGNDTFDRQYHTDPETGKQVTDKTISTAFFSVYKRVSKIMNGIINKEYQAPRPQLIEFSSVLGDDKKTMLYAKFAEKIQKTLGWDLITDENGFHIFDPDAVVDEDTVIEDTPEQRVADVDEIYGEGVPPWRSRATEPYQVTAIDIGEKTLYKHTDGGLYFDLEVAYNARHGYVEVTGEHIHYGERVTLTDELLPSTEMEWNQAVQNIQERIQSNLVDDNTLDQETMEPIDIETIEEALAGRDEVDPGDLLEDVFDMPTPEYEFHKPEMTEKAEILEKGKTKESFVNRVFEVLKTIKSYTREFRTLKRKEYGDVQFALRQLQKGKEQAAEAAVKHLNNIIGALNKTQYKNLQRLTYLMDLREQVIMNQEAVAKGVDPSELITLPLGWSDADIMQAAEACWDVVRADDQTYQAWRTRQDTWFRIRSAYKDATERVGFDASSRLSRVYYFRHQVMDALKAQQRAGLQGSNKLAVPTNRSMLRKRGATTAHDINLNYIQAEFEVMAQMTYDTQITNTLADIMDKHGSKTKKEGYVLYRPREESIFYMANTVPGRLVNDAMESHAKELNVPVGQVKKALAFGGKYKGYYLPAEVAETLEGALSESRGAMDRLFSWPLSRWKAWQLFNPMRAFKYNVRNLTGDAEAITIGSPAVFKYVKGSVMDLYKHAKGNTSPDLQAWIDRGGMQSTLQSAELEYVIEAPEFRKQMGKSRLKANPIAWGKAWFDLMRRGSDYREALLRYAAFKKFKAEIDNNNGKPERYVASIPEEVDALTDNADKAFMMSNDLLGAYDRISEGGQWLRRYIAPFWSFQEVNMKRSLVMWRNAINNDEAMSQIGRRLGVKSPIIAVKMGVLAVKFMAISALVQAYNEWKDPEMEDMLPEEMRNRPHILLTTPDKNDPNDRNVTYFPRIGVVGDLLEWGGLETAPSDVRDLIKLWYGEKTLEQIAADKEKIFEKYKYWEIPKRITNKVAQSFGPQFKMPAELVMGEKFFPSVWNRQPITDKGQWGAEQFGLRAAYDAVMKKPRKKGVLKKGVQYAFIYQEDKVRFGWLATQQNISAYKEKHNLKGRGFIVTETGTSLYNLGLAWRYGDEKAVGKYLAEYMILSAEKLSDVDFDTALKNQWEKLNPLKALPEKHQKLFLASLNERELKQLTMAIQYYAEMAGGIQFTKGN